MEYHEALAIYVILGRRDRPDPVDAMMYKEAKEMLEDLVETILIRMRPTNEG